MIDIENAWKVDLVIRKERPYSKLEFSRRVLKDLLGFTVWMSSPENTILAKLEWAKLGHSKRQLQDVSEMLHLTQTSWKSLLVFGLV